MGTGTRALATEPQPVEAPNTTAAAFLVLSVRDDPGSVTTARSVLGSTTDLIKDILVRAGQTRFLCTVGVGHRGRVGGRLT